jgi:precorrin isomerase
MTTSKELIERLAKEQNIGRYSGNHDLFILTAEELEAFAKAYQAAAPIDNVVEALEKAAQVCDDVKPIKPGSFYRGQREQSDKCAEAIRALIPDTQAKKGE